MSFRMLLAAALLLAAIAPAAASLALSHEMVRQVESERAAPTLAAARERAMVASLFLIGGGALLALLAAGALSRPLAKIRSGLEIMVGPNPGHRLGVHELPDLGAITASIDRLADRAERSRTQVETRLVEATRELASEKDTLASVLFALSDGVVVCNDELSVVLSNAAARRMLSLAARPLRRGEVIYAYLDRSLVGPLVESLGRDDGAARLEHGMLTLPSGELIHLTATVAGSAEVSRHYVFVLRDVTEQVTVDRSRDRFMAEAVQRLRSPASALLSTAEILRGYDELSSAARRAFLDVLVQEGERLAAELDAMHETASLGLAPAWASEVAIGELVEQAVAALDSVLAGRGQRITAAGGRALALGDRLALLQVICRLIELAAGRSPDGAELAVSWNVLEPDPSHRRRLVELVVELPAVPLEQAGEEAIFDAPLHDGRIEWTEAAPTVRGVATEHRGELWARATPRGSAYVFVLPAVEPVSEPPVDLGSDAVGRQVLALLGGDGFFHPRTTRGRTKPAHADELLAELSYAVFDLETTGLEPGSGDEIVSIGALRVRHGQVIREDYFSALVKPGRRIPPASTRIHGITDAMVAGQLALDEALPSFLEYVGDSVPVAHVASFDLAFLNPRLERLGRPPLGGGATLDTLLLSFSLFPEWDGYNLEEIAGRLGLRVVGRHTALGDALMTAEILVRLLEALEQRGVRTLGEALRFQGGDAVRKALGAVRARLAWG